jgi:hypothetical protein
MGEGRGYCTPNLLVGSFPRTKDEEKRRAVARGSRLQLRAGEISPLKCAAATVRITEQARSRLEQDRTATADSGTRQRFGPTAWLAFSVIS